MIRLTFFFSTLLTLAQSQEVNLQGLVKDKVTGIPIQGVEVSLLHKGLKDTSDDQGIFNISGSLGIDKISTPQQEKMFFFKSGRDLRFKNPSAGPVAIRISNIHGHSIYAANTTLDAGWWQFQPGPMQVGLYLIAITTRKDTYYSRFFLMTRDQHSRKIPKRCYLSENRNTSLLKTNVAAADDDTLKATKPGYFSYTLTIQNLTKSDLLLPLNPVESIYDGDWKGITDQNNLPLSFKVSRGKMTSINIIIITTVLRSSCIYETGTNSDVEIIDSRFSTSIGGGTVKGKFHGSFSSAETVSGTVDSLVAQGLFCEDVLIMSTPVSQSSKTWKASKQSVLDSGSTYPLK